MSTSLKRNTRIALLRPRIVKVVRDLSANKSRTLLVVLSIAVGIFAIAATLGARQVLLREFDRGFEESQKFSISYTLDDRAQGTGGVVRQIEARDDVLGVSGRRLVSAGFSLVPEGMSDAEALTSLPFPDTQREVIHIQAVPASEFQHSSGVSNFQQLQTRAWPPGPNDIILEASALQVFDFDIGDRILVEAGQEKAVFRVAGFAHDINAIPTMFFRQVEAYISTDALPHLGAPIEANRLLVRVDPELSRVQVANIAESIQEQQLNPANISINRMEVPEPGYHFFGSIFEAVSVLLLVMSFMALALSAFLVITTTNAILIQQTRQLGIMKAIGGRRLQIAGLYLGLVLCYGFLALAIGVPFGIMFGYAFIDYAAGILNFYVEDITFPLWVMGVLCATGLLLPALAALPSILKGVKKPIVDALGSYANQVGFGGGWLDQLLGKITFLSRPTALALRSTFARKGRLMLTLTTLILASAVVMSVFSARESLDLTVSNIGSWWKYDAQVSFGHPVRNDELIRFALSDDQVIHAETWLDGRTTIIRPDGTMNDSFWTVGIPEDSQILSFDFEEGGPPESGSNAVIISTELFVTEEQLSPPATVELIVGGNEIERPVAGIVTGSLQGAMMLMNRDDLAELQGIPGAATRVLVQAEGGQFAITDPRIIYERRDMQERVAERLDESFSERGYIVTSTQTSAGQLESASEQLGILTTFLFIMAGALAIVGVIGLSGSMTLSVIESTREIGIMRSVGASHRAIFGIYITQGLVVGTLSWFFGALLSWPVSYGLMFALRQALDMRLAYTFSFSGIFIWLAMVWIISIFASLLPAWRASQVSIRDAISHE